MERLAWLAGRIALLAVLSSLQACYPITYSAEEIEARVVDAGTKEPLEGVIVTANWQLVGGWEGHTPKGQMKVMETVTDEKGRFYFPAWGPRFRPLDGHLMEEDPLLLLFKPGYKSRALANVWSIKRDNMWVRRSRWDGKRIEMEPFKGTAEEYADHLGLLSNELYTLLGSETCDWKQIPQMLLALTQQSRRFRKLGINALYDVDVHLPVREGECGSPKAFFEAYRR